MTALARSAPQPHRVGLSKTRLLSGHRCIRKLWLELNEPESPEVADLDDARTIRWGRRVGETART